MNGRSAGLAVVTGASSGIGWALARQLAAGGHPVLAVARRAARLRALEEEAAARGWAPVHAFPRDLTDAGAIPAIAERAAELGGAAWLVNCAGIAVIRPFLETDPGALGGMAELNVVAPLLLTRALAPQLVEAEDAHLLNVASLAALQPCPWFAAYGATKAFLLALSEALSEELRGRVVVTVACPGPVRTEIFDVGAPGVQRCERFYDLSPEEAARAALAAAVRGRVVSVQGLVNRLAASMSRFSPRPVLRRISSSLAIRYIGYRPPAPRA